MSETILYHEILVDKEDARFFYNLLNLREASVVQIHIPDYPLWKMHPFQGLLQRY